jgi:hypothetical protein
VIGSLRKEGIGWIRISRPCRVHRLYFTYLTCDSRSVVAFRDAVILNEVLATP